MHAQDRTHSKNSASLGGRKRHELSLFCIEKAMRLKRGSDVCKVTQPVSPRSLDFLPLGLIPRKSEVKGISV